MYMKEDLKREAGIDPSECLILITTLSKRLRHFGDDIVLAEIFIPQKETSLRGSRNSPLVVSSVSLGSFSNHDDEGNNKATNLLI